MVFSTGVIDASKTWFMVGTSPTINNSGLVMVFSTGVIDASKTWFIMGTSPACNNNGDGFLYRCD